MPITSGSFERQARRVRKLARRYPALQPVVNRAGVVAWKAHLRYRGGGSLDPARLLYVDPGRIRTFLPREQVLDVAGVGQLQRNAIGKVRGGDWDSNPLPLEELGIFRAVRERLAGAEWDDTDFVRQIRADVAAGIPRFKFRRPEQVDPNLEAIDRLADSVRADGFRSQADLATGRPWDEILLAIDRNGCLHFVDGRHRLAIAAALGLPSVPALVTLRHAQWQRFTDDLSAYVGEGQHASYQPLLHPDLATLPSQQGHERFELIRSALPVDGGTLLDIGANKGYFCHRFEEVGFDCTAVERSEKELYFLEGLRRAQGRRFNVFRGSVFDLEQPEQYDVVLALNIFHHFLKSGRAHEELKNFLGRLRPRAMVFESHLPGDPQMRDAFVDYPPQEFVQFILEHSVLSRAAQIGVAPDGRPLFLLST